MTAEVHVSPDASQAVGPDLARAHSTGSEQSDPVDQWIETKEREVAPALEQIEESIDLAKNWWIDGREERAKLGSGLLRSEQQYPEFLRTISALNDPSPIPALRPEDESREPREILAENSFRMGFFKNFDPLSWAAHAKRINMRFEFGGINPVLLVQRYHAEGAITLHEEGGLKRRSIFWESVGTWINDVLEVPGRNLPQAFGDLQAHWYGESADMVGENSAGIVSRLRAAAVACHEFSRALDTAAREIAATCRWKSDQLARLGIEPEFVELPETPSSLVRRRFSFQEVEERLTRVDIHRGNDDSDFVEAFQHYFESKWDAVEQICSRAEEKTRESLGRLEKAHNLTNTPLMRR